MQISKVSLMICACVLATVLNLRAQDNPAQAAARAALAAKLFELDAQTPPATNTVTKAAKPVAKTAPAVAPAVKTVSPQPPVMMPVGGDAKAKVAADKAQAKADAEKAAADAKAKKIADQKAAEEKKAEQKKLAAQHESDVAAAKKQAKLNTDAAQKPPAPVFVAAPDMTAPPAPVNTSKQQQLADLLSKYKADQLTPDEYQQQRAAILAQP